LIRYFSENIDFKLAQKVEIKKWLVGIAKEEGMGVGDINYIFCDDEYLLGINKQYLDHDYYTDIITFDNAEDEGKIEGDIYVSIDRVQDNATNLKVSFDKELKRVLAHGVLHLCGYKDKTEQEERQMRGKEEYYLMKFD
jgi:probable rRNA maturation factor